VIRHTCVICDTSIHWRPNSIRRTCTAHRFEVITMPDKLRSTVQPIPNTSCIVCGVRLYRTPNELKRARFVSCKSHQGEAQQMVGRTSAQISAFEFLQAKQRLLRREAAPPPPPVVAPHITPSPSSVILCEVSEKHGFSVSELKGSERSNPETFAARSEAARRLRDERKLTPGQIGVMLGGRDSTTIMRMLDDSFRAKTNERSLRRIRTKSNAVTKDTCVGASPSTCVGG
jgi:hypothetical protein